MSTTLSPALGATKQYVGYASDDKPTSVVRGSTFFEVDTQNTYIWNGTAWLLVTIPSITTDKNQQMQIDLLQQILDAILNLR